MIIVLRRCKGNSKAIWKTIKSLSCAGENKSVTPQGVTLDAANEFNSHFATIADRLRSLLPSMPLDITKLEHFVLFRNVVFSIPPINKGYVVDAFRSLNPNKAIGVDRFSARICNIAAPAIAGSVTKFKQVYSIV